ncbi:MAG: 6-carboxytetrahydropterin synthase QueD [Bdellovibrionales bacterium RBG_16_40_8]|nr:MAG: 6-carboxytetrahydropterin synthase QueD [Bdellovibrionales bacterium RBG_16_40_8]
MLPNVPPGHKCGRLHGHSYKMTLIVRGPLLKHEGWIMDFSDIKLLAKPVIDKLDHRYLNEIPGLENPTAEVLARWIYENLQVSITGLYQVIINETCTAQCRYPV